MEEPQEDENWALERASEKRQINNQQRFNRGHQSARGYRSHQNF